MFLHRDIFNVVDNFHSLFCKGDQNYEQAVFDIQIYNLTKVLGSKVSIPSHTGEKKKDYINFDVINAIFED